MVVNCIIPGGQRCGSTYLFKLISNFENVKNPISLKSEPKWFLEKCSEKSNSMLYNKEVFGIDENDSEVLCLEKSTSYFADSNAADRINKILGQIPIVIIIRDPIARAISHFRFSKSNGFEDLKFSEAIYLNPKNRSYSMDKSSTNPFEYIENGLYSIHLKRWMDVFPNLKVVFLEEIINFQSIFLEICEYIGLDAKKANPYWNSRKVNQSPVLPNDIRENEIQYLQSIFWDHNRELQILLGRKLPSEWSTII